MKNQVIFCHIGIALILPCCVFGVFEFPSVDYIITRDQAKILSRISESDIKSSIELGILSIDRQEQFEFNLINSEIVVTNGSISHAQYLETFPNENARKDDKTARKILQSSLYILNSHCLPQNIPSQLCADYFSTIPLPTSELRDQCLSIVNDTRDGHNAFRRLLSAHYKDGFYKMHGEPKLPKPREITNLGLNNNFAHVYSETGLKDCERNLIFVQWAQFIEHDLSKSVVTSMQDGTPIECCNEDYYKLTPRHVHPACAPLEGVSPPSEYDKIPCLNYVRSALAVDPLCNFGPAEQLNQATGTLDLSQLYGFTKESKMRMRSFKNGRLKVSYSKSSNIPLLPIADDKKEFCVTDEDSTSDCFMAGDTRVNSNPFVTMLYTVFLRSHNKIAKNLKAKYQTWSDELLYNEARRINIEMYRYIVYNEWLPTVLGEKITKIINEEQLKKIESINTFGVSNEFAVAAARFYFSMMPNELYKSTKPLSHRLVEENLIDVSLGSEPPLKLFSLKDQFYTSDFATNPRKINTALDAMLNQKAMKMDSSYAESVSKDFLQTASSLNRTSGTDSLAWDIQRGRDHGLQPYIKYLEQCENTKITNWNDLLKFIKQEDIAKLKLVYKNFKDIDLIVGGISEKPANGSTVGPTFACILGEQFSNIRKWQYNLENRSMESFSNLPDESNNKFGNFSAAKLLCHTTDLNAVPRNIFLVPSEKNLLISCTDMELR